MRRIENFYEEHRKARRLFKLVKDEKITEDEAFDIAFYDRDFCDECGSLKDCEHGEREDDA